MIETFVRPFETGDVTPGKKVPYAQPTQLPQNVKIQVGRIGAARTFSGSASTSISYYTIKYPKETTR